MPFKMSPKIEYKYHFYLSKYKKYNSCAVDDHLWVPLWYPGTMLSINSNAHNINLLSNKALNAHNKNLLLIIGIKFFPPSFNTNYQEKFFNSYYHN